MSKVFGRSVVTICLVLGLLGGCSSGPAASTGAGDPRPSGGSAGLPASLPQVTGSITWRERIALSPQAILTVRLIDVSLADAPAIVLGEQIIRPQGTQPPYSFAIAYDAARLRPGHSYAVSARVEEAGRLRFINDTRYSVLSDRAGTHVDMVLRSVP